MEPALATTTPLSPPETATRASRGLVLIVGVVVIPMALSILFNSWGPLTEESAMRMAFASVAGQTIAILSTVVTLVMTAASRRWRQLPLFFVIAIFVWSAASTTMGAAAENLSSRLSTVEEVEQLTR